MYNITYNGVRIFQAVRMMVAVRLHDHLDLPIIFLIIGSQLRAVFLIGNNAVRGSCNQYDLHMLLQKLIRLVNGIPPKGKRGLVCEMINCLALLPLLWIALCSTISSRPACDVQNRRVQIKCGNRLRIFLPYSSQNTVRLG